MIEAILEKLRRLFPHLTDDDFLEALEEMARQIKARSANGGVEHGNTNTIQGTRATIPEKRACDHISAVTRGTYCPLRSAGKVKTTQNS